jgi:hypothetical protein
MHASFVISEMTKRNQMKDCDNEGGKEDMELPMFDLAAITNATDNFSIFYYSPTYILAI